MTNLARTVAVLGIAIAWTACGGTVSPTEIEEREEFVRQIKAAPSFAVDIQEIIVRTGCGDGGCHGSGQGSLWLGADPAANYAALVNRQAVTESQFVLVKPFDADSSYVIMRFENRQADGLPSMPVGPPLDDIDLTNWKNWINSGAGNN